MYIRRLYLRHFRNYGEVEVQFSEQMNLIRGQNAQGKTNLLEALYLIGTGRSFRTTHLKELIHHAHPFFFVEAEFLKDGLVQRVRLSFDGETKKLDYNNTSYSYFSPLLGLLPIVLLAPEDVLLISGAPAERRRFLDLHRAQSDPLYVHHLTRYHKAVKHRNFMLRKKSTESIETWETLMVISAKYLKQQRQEMITALADHLRSSMLELSDGKDTLKIDYIPSYTEDYREHRAKEMIVGSTFVGPHRDDLEILINDQEARSFASQGQLRTAIAAIRLAQWKHLKEHHQVPPLFCIDDFAVHLDGDRRSALLKQMTHFGQVFLTSPSFHELSFPSIEVTGGRFNHNLS